MPVASLLIGAAVNLASQGGVQQAVVSADQAYERTIKQYEFAMEQQKLKREDIRDLVELTVGRMDVYHVVGALLLQFCIKFYCQNQLLEEANGPFWVLSLFLISNAGAVGYLLFAVWLSMHASVSSHSVGVRLLLNYTRVTVPSPEELRQAQKARTLYAQVGQRVNGWLRSDLERPMDSMDAGQEHKLTPLLSASFDDGGGDLSKGDAGAEKPVVSKASHSSIDNLAGMVPDAYDMETHKQVFQEEQAKWLSYDAYARTCMALGINQMLQALCYYIVGPVATRSPTGAVMSLVVLQTLTILLLRLDVTDDRIRFKLCEGISDLRWVLLVLTCPVVLTGLLTMLGPHTHYTRIKALLATPTFYFHWLWLHTAQREIEPNREMLPKRLRTVCYLEVLEPAEEAANCVRDIIDAQRSLRQGVRAVFSSERRANAVSATYRGRAELEAVRCRLETAMRTLRGLLGDKSSDAALAQAAAVEQMLRLFELWREVPKLQAGIRALRATSAWHKESFEEECATFERMCEELDLVNFVGSASDRCSVTGEELAIEPKLSAMERQSSDRTFVTHVMVEDPTDHVYDGHVWVDVRTGSHAFHPSEDAVVISVFEVEVMYGAWVDLAKVALAKMRRLTHNPLVDLGESELTAENAARHLAMPRRATPPKPLPWLIVQRYTMTLKLMWALGGAVHCFVAITDIDAQQRESAPAIHASQLGVAWPAPARLFEVSSLHCNDSFLVVSSRFSLYSAPLGSLAAASLRGIGAGARLAELSEVPGALPSSAILCAAGSQCRSLTQSDEGAWELASLERRPLLGELLPGVSEEVPVPPAWRLVTAAWAACTPSPCQAGWVAGWDARAAEVVVATLQRQASGTWSLRYRFSVRPSLGRCVGSASECAPFGPVAYGDVRALSLSSDRGRLTLAILLGNDRVTSDTSTYLDAWDLDKGSRLGRWRFASGHTSMCSSGTELFFARPGPEGPVLETAALPSALQKEL